MDAYVIIHRHHIKVGIRGRRRQFLMNFKGNLVIWCTVLCAIIKQQYTNSKNINETKKMEFNWSHTEKTSILHHQTSPDMESTREEEKRTAKNLLAARHGGGSEENGYTLQEIVIIAQLRIQWRLSSMAHASSEYTGISK